MGDFLMKVGGKAPLRRVISSLGLPIPLPRRLRRNKEPWQEQSLAGQRIVVGGAEGALHKVLAPTLAGAGATLYLAGWDRVPPAYAKAGQSVGRPPSAMPGEAIPSEFLVHGLIFDATGITDPAGLRDLYDFFHPLVRRVAACGRIVLLGRPATGRRGTAEAAAAAGLEGFIRSLAKEVGRKGVTAQLLTLAPDAEERLGPPLLFLLSERSAFITGQVLAITATAADGEALRYAQPLAGKVVLVTGAARGIGKATACALAREGAQVVVLDHPREEGPARETAAEINGEAILYDLSDPEAPSAIAKHLRKDFKGVDVVVHNAGITRDKTLGKMSGRHWDQVLAVNLEAVVKLTEALLKGPSVLRKGGRIICVSSVAGIAGNFGQTNYAAAKAGLIGFVRELAPLLSSRGITVNAIAPGFIETRMTASIPALTREAGRRMSALGQGGLPQDVAEAITFLASPGAVGLTGGVLRVCGGSLIGA